MNNDKDTKKELFVFSSVDYYSLKEYFEDMARKGWLIYRIKYNIATYRRIEPTDLTFSVDVYPTFNVFEAVNEDDIKSYKNLCEDAGWSHATSSGNLHIFYSKKEDNLIPIQTDEEINKMVVEKSIYPEVISLVLIIILALVNMSYQLPYDYENLFSNVNLLMPLFWIVLLMNLLITSGGSILWLLKAKKNIDLNKPLPRTNFKKSRAISTISTVFSISLLILFVSSMILDSIINPNKTMLFIGVIAMVPITSYVYNKGIKTLKIGKVFKVLLLFIIIIILFASSIFITLRMDMAKEGNLEPEYIGFTYEDFDLNTKPRHISFDKGGSILVPIYFNYGEVGAWLETTYVETRGNKIARYIFDGMLIEELERNNKNLSNAGNEYLGYDEAYYIDDSYKETKNTSLFLLKDNKILFLVTDFDLSEDKYIDIITNKIRDGII